MADNGAGPRREHTVVPGSSAATRGNGFRDTGRSPRIVGIIPARGGSKGVSRKNLVPFLGRPLLEWSIIQALAAEHIGEVVVSTDDEEIAEVARDPGARVVWRPDRLSGDEAPAEAALLHAIEELEVGDAPPVDLVVFLQATSPIREPSDLDAGVEQFLRDEHDSLFSGSVMDDLCVWTTGEDGRPVSLTYDWTHRVPRQERGELILENGSFWIFPPSLLRETGNRLGGRIGVYRMPFWKSFEIDELPDVPFCEMVFRDRLSAHALRPGPPIGLLVFDFDGVMTDNRVYLSQEGVESVRCHRGDGLAIDHMKEAGLRMMIVSTERNPVVARRAEKLGIPCAQDIGDKREFLAGFCEKEEIRLEHVAFVGNDVNDVPAMKLVGLPVATRDAHPEAVSAAAVLLRSHGGEGAVRELSEIILRTLEPQGVPCQR